MYGALYYGSYFMGLFGSSSRINMLLVYVVLVLIWSATPLAIVWSVQEVHPMWVLIIRYIGASILALMILMLMRESLPLDVISITSYIAGSLNLIGAQFFIYLAAHYLTSGLMALLFGFAPLIAGLVGHVILKNQKLMRWQWLGMCIAILGLVFVFIDQTGRSIQPVGVILIILGMISYVISIFWVKHIAAPLSIVSQATGSLLISALASLLIVPFIFHQIPTQMPSRKAWIGFLFTMILSSIVAMFCYFWLIRRIKPSTIALSNVITPVIALVLGATLNHEQINQYVIMGVIIILAGMFLYFYRQS